jgi:hypothetical protein
MVRRYGQGQMREWTSAYGPCSAGSAESRGSCGESWGIPSKLKCDPEHALNSLLSDQHQFFYHLVLVAVQLILRLHHYYSFNNSNSYLQSCLTRSQSSYGMVIPHLELANIISRQQTESAIKQRRLLI